MNTGAFGEGFPYTNFHDLNMDWIVKIAKDFLDQYTNIQNTITTGLEELDTKAEELENALEAWYEEHSDEIAQQLADALDDLNDWYTEHQGYLNQYLTDSITAFNNAADAKAEQTIESIPDDYTALSNEVTELKSNLVTTTPTVEPSGAYTLPVNNRYFLAGYATGKITAINLRFRRADTALVEFWEKRENTLYRIDTETLVCATDYTYMRKSVDVESIYPIYISVLPTLGTSVSYVLNTSNNAYNTSDTESTELDISALPVYTGLTVVGFCEYVAGDYEDLVEKNETLESIINPNVTSTPSVEPSGAQVLPVTSRWFLNGFAFTEIQSVSLRFREAGTALVEVWEVVDNHLKKIGEKTVTGTAYTYHTFPLEATSNHPMMVSVTCDNKVSFVSNTDYDTFFTTDLLSTDIVYNKLSTYVGMCIVGYTTYLASSLDTVLKSVYIPTRSPVERISSGIKSYYSTISSAVSDAVDGDTIIVKPGTYTDPINAWGKTISIIGIDKSTCIIRNTTGNYATPAVKIDSGYLANLTIISDASSPTITSADEGYMLDYSIHVDNNHATDKTLIIENCIIQNNHRASFGIGLYDHNTVIIRNCDVWSGKPPADIPNPSLNKRGVLYFHNRQPSEYFSNVTEQYLRVINCTMFCEDIIAVYVGDTTQNVDMTGKTNEMTAEFINNMFTAKNANGTYRTTSNGVCIPPDFANDSCVGGTGFTNRLKLSAISFGNNVQYFNN